MYYTVIKNVKGGKREIEKAEKGKYKREIEKAGK